MPTVLAIVSQQKHTHYSCVCGQWTFMAEKYTTYNYVSDIILNNNKGYVTGLCIYYTFIITLNYTPTYEEKS